ncbi:MAG: ComEC/Rec2 family competence protein [Pseudomonadota bacterium]|nr:ComEC/Rec2 family competence protein [Pseudomonadota bacterium]
MPTSIPQSIPDSSLSFKTPMAAWITPYLTNLKRSIIYLTDHPALTLLLSLTTVFNWFYHRHAVHYFQRQVREFSTLVQQGTHCQVTILSLPSFKRLHTLNTQIIACGPWQPDSPIYLNLKIRGARFNLGDNIQVNINHSTLIDPWFVWQVNPTRLLGKRNLGTTVLLSRQQWHSFSKPQKPSIIHSWKQFIKQQLTAAYAGHYPNSLNIIIALLFGETTWLKFNQWQLLQASGTVHLVAISGLHFSTLSQILNRLLAPMISYRWPYFPRVICQTLSTILLSTYACLIGWPASTQRAWLNEALKCLDDIRFAYHSPLIKLCLSAQVCFWYDPLIIHQIGFQLSYGMVASLLILQMLRPKLSPIKNAFLISVISAPWTYAYFGNISWISFLCNLIAVPAISYIILPLCLFFMALTTCSVTASQCCLQLACWLTNNLCKLLSLLIEAQNHIYFPR